jgi:signal transduction histidine kinase
MRERAGVIGGRLVVWSAPGEGTEVELRVPTRAAHIDARTV